MRRPIPDDCSFNGRGAGECWACPNIFCRHLRHPFADRDETHEVSLAAAARIRDGRVRSVRSRDLWDDDAEVATELERMLLLNIRELRMQQAVEAVRLGFADLTQAANFAKVDRTVLHDRVRSAKARTP